MADDRMTLHVDIQVNLPLWQAFKLRLAGATYVQGYIEHLIAMQMRLEGQDDEDDEEDDDAGQCW